MQQPAGRWPQARCWPRPRRWRLATAALWAGLLPGCAGLLAACGGHGASPRLASPGLTGPRTPSPSWFPAGVSPVALPAPSATATRPATNRGSATAPGPAGPPASAGPPPGSAPPAASPPAAAAAGTPCPASALQASIGPASGAAGSSFYPIVLTNTSGAACTLFGYPGVSLVTAIGGSQVGQTAARNPALAATVVTLAPGSAAHATLQSVSALNYPASRCKPVTAAWLRIYPPAQFTPLYVRFTATTCTGQVPATLGIFVVRPGPTGT